MKKYMLFLFLALLGSVAYATPLLKVGDVLLQPLNCWLCNVIESEENSIYSHMGVVVSSDPVLVAEAYGKVRAVSLDEFNVKTERGQKLAIIRFKDSAFKSALEQAPERFFQMFELSFAGKKYDSAFLWDNVDENGEELLYCSELVAKLFKAFLGDSVETPIKRMHFSKNYEFWFKHFKGKVPVGEWGNSPGDFERSPLFEQIGEI